MKTLLFSDQYHLRTGLSIDEIKNRLQDHCDASRTPMILSETDDKVLNVSGKPYCGKVDTAGFEICRIPESQTSFIVVIKGEYDHYLGKTEVKVSTKLHKFSIGLIAVIVLIGMGVPAGYLYLKGFSLSPVEWFTGVLLPFIVVPWVLAGAIVAFNKESKRTYAFLLSQLEAEKI